MQIQPQPVVIHTQQDHSDDIPSYLKKLLCRLDIYKQQSQWELTLTNQPKNTHDQIAEPSEYRWSDQVLKDIDLGKCPETTLTNAELVRNYKTVAERSAASYFYVYLTGCTMIFNEFVNHPKKHQKQMRKDYQGTIQALHHLREQIGDKALKGILK